MVGTYTIQAGDTASPDLAVNSYTQTSNPAIDVYGNVMTSTTVPTGTDNISGHTLSTSMLPDPPRQLQR